jgi:stress-induced morphogen
MPSIQDIQDQLEKSLNLSKLEIQDISSGCGSSFDLLIVSDDFTGLNLLKRQRLIHSILKEFMTDIHALTMKTLTPEEY